MSLRRYDLNLLPVLEALLRHRNVTNAGKEIGLSQSATSHALLRLRQLFGDELLVPSGRGMVLSRRAEELLGLVRNALDPVERLFLDVDSFVPEKSARQFKVMMADYVAAVILPTLQAQIEREAPNVNLQTTWGHGNLEDALLANQLDLVIMPKGSLNCANVLSQDLFTDELVVIAARDNPEVGDNIDFETFQRLPQVIFRKDETAFSSFSDRELERQAISRKETVIVPEFLLLPMVVSQTRCLALTHRLLAEHMSHAASIKILPPPFTTRPVVISAFWSQAMDTDAGHQWFRQLLIKTSNDVVGRH